MDFGVKLRGNAPKPPGLTAMGNNRGYCGWPSFSILTQRTIRTESQAAVGRWESAYPGHCADAAAGRSVTRTIFWPKAIALLIVPHVRSLAVRSGQRRWRTAEPTGRVIGGEPAVAAFVGASTLGIAAREGFGAVGDGAARCSQGRGICGICGIWGICGSCGICGICGISGKHCPW